MNKQIETTVITESKNFESEMVEVDGQYAGVIARIGRPGVFQYLAERAGGFGNPSRYSTRDEALCSIAYPAFYR